MINSIVPVLSCVLGLNLPLASCQVHKYIIHYKNFENFNQPIIGPKKQTTTPMKNHESVYLTDFPPFSKKLPTKQNN